MHDLTKKGLHTQVIHAGQHIDPATGAVSTPIYQSSTFAFCDADHGAASFRGDEDGGFIYTRLGNPTIMALERNLAALENGCGAMGCATGMAAVNLVYYALLSQGDHVVCTESLYGPSRTVLETEYPRFGISASFVDTSDPENVRAALRPETKLVYLETPANPTLKLADLPVIIITAHGTVDTAVTALKNLKCVYRVQAMWTLHNEAVALKAQWKKHDEQMSPRCLIPR